MELTDAASTGDFVSADAVRFTFIGDAVPGERCVPQEDPLVTLGGGGNCFGLDLPGMPEPHPDTKYAIHSDLPEAFTGNGVLYTTRDIIPADPTNLIPLSLRTQTNAGFSTIDDDFDVFIFHISRPGDGSQPRRIVVHVENNGPEPVTIEPDQVIVTQGIIGNVHEMESNLGSRWMAEQYDSGRPSSVTIPSGSGAVIGWSNNFSGFGAGIDANINCFGLLRGNVVNPNANTDLDVSVVAIPAGQQTDIDTDVQSWLNVAATSQEGSINLTTPPAPFELRRAVGVFENFQWRSDPVTIDVNALSGTEKTFAMALSEIQASGCPAGRQTVPMILHPGFAHGDTIGNYQVDYRVNLHLVNSSQSELRAFDIEFGRSGADIGLAWRVATGETLPTDAETDATPVYTEWAGPFQDDGQFYDSMLEPAGGAITMLPCTEMFVQVRFTVLGNSSLPFQLRVVPATPDPGAGLQDWWMLQ